MKPKAGGFTLIELLVVIAIIALLATMLTPMVSKSIQSARTRQCASNLRQIGLGLLNYAQDHEGRFPGSATTTGSVSWHDILRLGNYVGMPVQRMGPTPLRGQLYCPSMKPYKNLYPRAYMMNGNALGGLISGAAPYGPYGMAGQKTEIGPTCTFLRYGARIGMSPRPSFQVLMTESERHTDELWYQSTFPAVPPLGDSADFPPWSGPGGLWAFRHDLKANQVFFDGHVETLGSTVSWNTAERLSFE
jgi:prepilin-type N-terminal cleavage/methylation domain-containing protein/prepilin-type processing-associated H-X9-DG protein